MYKNVCVMCIVVWFYLLGTISPSDQALSTEEQAPSIDEIVHQFAEAKRKLFIEDESFFIRYTSIVAENRLSTDKNDEYHSVVYTNGRKSKLWGTCATLAGTEKQNQETKHFAVNGKIIDWSQYSNHAVVAPFEDGRNMYHHWSYFQGIGIVPYDLLAEANGTSFDSVLVKATQSPYLEPILGMYLPACIDTYRSKYSMRSKPETVDGISCWVLEWPNRDVIWLDMKLTGVIRKRTIYNASSGTLKSVFYNSDVKEVKKGLFLPYKQDARHYVYPEMGLSQSETGKELSHFVYQVNILEFCSVRPEAEKFFDVQLPVGAGVYDVAKDVDYRISDPHSDPFAGPIAQGLRIRRHHIIRSICITLGFMLMCLAVYVKMFRSKK